MILDTIALKDLGCPLLVMALLERPDVLPEPNWLLESAEDMIF